MNVINDSSQQVVLRNGELLAIVMFTRHYRHRLLGREFTIRTDHGSLTGLFSSKNPVAQFDRWLEELSQYAMPIQHCLGVRPANADGRSCTPEQLDECDCCDAGQGVCSLPCGGCPYCTKLHSQWNKLENKVHYGVPLAIRHISSLEANATSATPATSDDVVDPSIGGSGRSGRSCICF